VPAVAKCRGGFALGCLFRSENEVGRIAVQRNVNRGFGDDGMPRETLHRPESFFRGFGALAELALLLDPDVAHVVRDYRQYHRGNQPGG
jgi:hypothetical protein